MKTKILKSTIAILLGAATLAVAEDSPFRPKDDKVPKENHQSSSSSATVTNTNGEVTIEIDVNGKKERKTFKLGEGGEPFTWKLDNNGATASGSASVGGAAKLGDLLKKGRDAALAKLEKVTWLGVATDNVSDEVRAQLPLQTGEGLVVRNVVPESPAAKAGLEEHDILTRVDDQILVSNEQLSSLVKMHKPGEAVKLTYLRKGEKKEGSAVLEQHEGQPEDVLRMLGVPGKFGLNGPAGAQLREAEQRLLEMRDKLPGIIMDKQLSLIGPNGVVEKFANRKAEEILDQVRKELESAKITPEKREEIRKTLEDVVRSAREATQMAEEALKQAKEPAPPKHVDPQTEDKKP